MTASHQGDELAKLSGHLSLLRSEYVKLQNRLGDLEKENALLRASQSEGEEFSSGEDSLAVGLLETSKKLFNSARYSDLKVILSDQEIYAHKFIFQTRSQTWRGQDIHSEDVKSLDWRDMDSAVGMALCKWIYTDRLNFAELNDTFILTLMKGANEFNFSHLRRQCENFLISTVEASNCIRYFATAEEIRAEDLKNHCSNLIYTHWYEFTKEDFSHLQAPLLYTMLKSKMTYPLHFAIRIHREDVVFLYLIESKSKSDLDTFDEEGDLPLDLALRSSQDDLARSLIEHKANVDQVNAEGSSILNLAISRGDIFSCDFLIENGCSVNLPDESGGNYPLHLAAKDSSMMSIAKKLIEKGANANSQNKLLMSPLHTCLLSKNREFFDFILELSDLLLETKSSEGYPPLWYALQDEDFYFAKKLIDKNVGLNTICSSEGDSLLHECAKAGFEESCVLLINEKDCVINLANIRGVTPLHIAAEKGLLKVAGEMLKKGNSSSDIIESQTVPERQTPLHLAIACGNTDIVNIILNVLSEVKNVSPNFNLKNADDHTPLSLALSKGLHDIAIALLKGGANINVSKSNGLTLLHTSIIDGDNEGSKFLLNHGASMDLRTGDKKTPLELAIENDMPEVVEILCRKGADLSLTASNDPPFWRSLSINKEIAHILVRHGVDTDCWALGPEGCFQTLLHRAIDENDEESAKFLIRAGCDTMSPRRLGPDGQGGEEAKDMSTPLHLCCRWGLENVVRELLEHEAPINSKDAEGKTPIHIAIEESHHPIINILLEYKPELTLRDNSGVTPFASAMNFKNNKAAQKILDIEPTAAEIYDSRGRNFLHTAILRNDLESVLFLISIKVNIHSKMQDSNRLSPLLLAVKLGNDMIVRNLLLAGASAGYISEEGQSALHIASENGFPVICGILLSNGVDFSVVDNRGNNALHIGVKEGNYDVVRTLLTESQIDAEAFNNKGRNPLHVLANFGDENSPKILELFLECMPDYSINKTDEEGNSPLLLAYIKGNGPLCRALAKRGAVLGIINRHGVSIFNYHVATKQLLYGILDCLSSEPKWGEGDTCQECREKFGLTKRKHHCRHCGRLLCGKCSDKHIPILKYNFTNPVRVCEVCSDILTIGPGLAASS